MVKMQKEWLDAEALRDIPKRFAMEAKEKEMSMETEKQRIDIRIYITADQQKALLNGQPIGRVRVHVRKLVSDDLRGSVVLDSTGEWLPEERAGAAYGCGLTGEIYVEDCNDPQRNNGGTTWLTCDEIAFVQHLGTQTERGVKTARLVHLQRYLEAAARRHAWGKIDQAAVIREAEKLLRAEQRKGVKSA